ncbi:MAG TPA: nucleotidyltransferase domain-containing protein [Bacteroidota bacterium]
MKKYLGSRTGVRVFLFGSRAGGHFTERSDFDIGIMLHEPGGNLRRVPLELMSRMNEEVEKIPLLQKIDLVDFGRVGEEFQSVALEKIILLYER